MRAFSGIHGAGQCKLLSLQLGLFLCCGEIVLIMSNDFSFSVMERADECNGNITYY